MSLVTHLEALQHKHAMLEQAIYEESHRPSPDFAKVTTLKKQKLTVKEEMSSIMSSVSPDAMASA